MVEFVALLLFSLAGWLIIKRNQWRDRALFAEIHLTELKRKIKRRNAVAVDLDLATTAQIFEEMSKRGRVVLLIPHQQNNITFVETLAAQMSPTQTMDVLRVAYTGIAGHLDGTPPDEEDE